jgi:predicted  nucleic acid-binding Zn-ribbon protein
VTEDLERLLVVQDLDTTTTQLQHRRDALVETTGLSAVEAQLAALEVERADAAARRGVLAATQKELEEQIGGITDRRDVVEKRMYAATGSSGRDLQAMQDEVRHLTERRAELEELELVSMLEQDPIDAELAALRVRTEPLETQAVELRALVGEGQVEIDAALAEAHEARSAEAALLPAAL